MKTKYASATGSSSWVGILLTVVITAVTVSLAGYYRLYSPVIRELRSIGAEQRTLSERAARIDQTTIGIEMNQMVNQQISTTRHNQLLDVSRQNAEIIIAGSLTNAAISRAILARVNENDDRQHGISMASGAKLTTAFVAPTANSDGQGSGYYDLYPWPELDVAKTYYLPGKGGVDAPLILELDPGKIVQLVVTNRDYTIQPSRNISMVANSWVGRENSPYAYKPYCAESAGLKLNTPKCFLEPGLGCERMLLTTKTLWGSKQTIKIWLSPKTRG